MVKRLSILGSTGFIGRNTLEVARAFPERFQVVALSAGANIDLLAKQIGEFKPKVVALAEKEMALKLKQRLSGDLPRILWGVEGLIEVASIDEADTVVSAIVGASGLVPTLAAINGGKDVALANKESLVMAGKIMMDAVAKAGVNLLPVDSEHSAIFQSLSGENCRNRRQIRNKSPGYPGGHGPSAPIP